MINTVNASHDTHLLKIDNREDELLTRLSGWKSAVMKSVGDLLNVSLRQFSVKDLLQYIILQCIWDQESCSTIALFFFFLCFEQMCELQSKRHLCVNRYMMMRLKGIANASQKSINILIILWSSSRRHYCPMTSSRNRAGLGQKFRLGVSPPPTQMYSEITTLALYTLEPVS